MKLKLIIDGNPKINKSIHYTKKGIKYKPATASENEKSLRASIINLLPYDFRPFTGPVRINMMHFIFPPAASLNHEEKQAILNGVDVCKISKPHIVDCIDCLIKALTGTVLLNYEQVCGLTDLNKYYGAEPRIIIEIEEL